MEASVTISFLYNVVFFFSVMHFINLIVIIQCTFFSRFINSVNSNIAVKFHHVDLT